MVCMFAEMVFLEALVGLSVATLHQATVDGL